MDELDDIFSLEFPDGEIETNHRITARQMRHHAKRRMQAEMKEDRAREIVRELPEPGEAIHIVSDGKFDYWNFVPVMVDLLPRKTTDAYFSTWTLNRQTCVQLFELLDQGRIQTASMITDLYFKRREAAVYAKLLTGLAKRKMRLRSLENHAKVTLLAADQDFIVMEGSANFTGNPRIEQNMITNSKELYEFHKGWMEEVLEAKNDAEET